MQRHVRSAERRLAEEVRKLASLTGRIQQSPVMVSISSRSLRYIFGFFEDKVGDEREHSWGSDQRDGHLH